MEFIDFVVEELIELSEFNNFGVGLGELVFGDSESLQVGLYLWLYLFLFLLVLFLEGFKFLVVFLL